MKSRKNEHLAAKVDILPSQFAEMRELLRNLQPDRPVPQANSPQAAAPAPAWDDDVLSPRASCTGFNDEPRAEQVEEAAHDSFTISEWSGRESRMGSGPTSASIKRSWIRPRQYQSLETPILNVRLPVQQ